jgi:hypothetical protein
MWSWLSPKIMLRRVTPPPNCCQEAIGSVLVRRIWRLLKNWRRSEDVAFVSLFFFGYLESYDNHTLKRGRVFEAWILLGLTHSYESCERNLFVLWANTCQQETVIFFIARNLPRTEELVLLGPQVILPLLKIPTVGVVAFYHWLEPMFISVISFMEGCGYK